MLFRKDIIVDPEHQHIVDSHTWHLHTRGYVTTHIDGKTTFLHKLILITDKTVDHKNNNKLDNRRNNLREATYTQNAQNRLKTKLNTSGYKGVTWIAAKNMWRAQLGTKSLAYFTCPIAAAKCYDAAALKAYGQFANINGV